MFQTTNPTHDQRLGQARNQLNQANASIPVIYKSCIVSMTTIKNDIKNVQNLGSI